MKIIIFSTTIFLLFYACRKEEPVPIPPEQPVVPALKVIWQHPLSPDTTDVFGAAWYIWQGNVIYTTDFTVPEGQIHCRDASTGEMRWKRDDLYNDGWGNRQIVSIEHKTIACMQHRVYCIDNKTGQNVWKQM